MIADSGASGHYLTLCFNTENKWVAKNPISVKLPNGTIIQNTHECYLPIPNLPKEAILARIFPQLHSASLLSIGQLCDAGCEATMNERRLNVYLNNELILTGPRNKENKMWEVTFKDTLHPNMPSSVSLHPNMPSSVCNIITNTTSNTHTNQLLNNVYRLTTTSSVIMYLHAVAFFPVKSTWLKAIKKNFYATWPFLTYDAVNKYLPPSPITSRAHIRQEQKNLRSTKVANRVTRTHKNYDINIQHQDDTPINSELVTYEDYEDTNPIIAPKSNDVIVQVEDTKKIYSDQTGAFPFPSSRGYRYIMIAYDVDSNAIMTRPLKSKKSIEMNIVLLGLINHLTKRGFKPNYWIMDNECSTLVKDMFGEMKIDYQLVPAGNHRRNAAERAIQTFKHHLVAGLLGVDPNFPLHLWDKLLPQCEITLNMLRASRTHPQISANDAVNGTFDFNKTPMAPVGCKAVIHEKLDKRKTWDSSGINGWYVGPAMEHYRCYTCYVPKTRGFRNCDTVDFFPHNIALTPETTSQQIARKLDEVIKLCKNIPEIFSKPTDRSNFF